MKGKYCLATTVANVGRHWDIVNAMPADSMIAHNRAVRIWNRWIYSCTMLVAPVDHFQQLLTSYEQSANVPVRLFQGYTLSIKDSVRG